MHYEMRSPCDQCPFLKGSGFTFPSLMAHASGEFPCHKKCDLDEEDSTYVEKRGKTRSGRDKTPHCAGALIFLEKMGRPHQMMRICERIGMYDRTKLNMDANVGSKPSDYRAHDEQDSVGAEWLEQMGMEPEDLEQFEEDPSEVE